jgi:hypothetical protein
MADILASDIKLLAAERMTDLDDSGGYPSNTEVLDNVDNNLFPDIASGNRIAGAFQHRMIYAAVRSPNDAMFLASRAYIASLPTDTTVNPLIWPGQGGDERPEALASIYAAKGANTNLRLYTDYGPGTTRLTFYWDTVNQTVQPALRPEMSGSFTGLLEDISAGSLQTVTLKYVGSGGVDDARMNHYDCSPALTQTFNGAYFADEEHANYATPTQLYLPDPQELTVYGITTLENAASISDNEIDVADNERPLAPLVSQVISGSATQLTVNRYGFIYFAQVVNAAAGRIQTLPVEGSYDWIQEVYYRVNGAWVQESFVKQATTNFIVTLANTPDAGSKLIYFTATEHNTTYYSQGTKFVFLLTPPVEPSSVTITALDLTETALTATDNGVGGFTGDVTAGTIDYTTGLVTVTLDATCYTINVLCEYLYTALLDDLPNLGIELAKLPLSKTAPIFRVGDYVIVHHTDHETLANPLVANTTYTLNRANVRQIWLEDAVGARIPTTQYTIDLSAGSIHTIVGLNLSGYQQPIEAFTTIHDEAVIIGLLNDAKTLRLSQGLTYNYLADETYVSSLLWCGDLFASVTTPFAQQSWTSVWSDALIGSVITPQFSHQVYPIEVTNDGAITERWRIQFTGATTVHVIGEHVGQIATSLSTTADIAPVNPFTSQPYFTIPYEGWGAGWVSGNLLRFNTQGADQAIHCARISQPSASAVTDDNFKLVFLGDVDA